MQIDSIIGVLAGLLFVIQMRAKLQIRIFLLTSMQCLVLVSDMGTRNWLRVWGSKSKEGSVAYVDVDASVLQDWHPASMTIIHIEAWSVLGHTVSSTSPFLSIYINSLYVLLACMFGWGIVYTVAIGYPH